MIDSHCHINDECFRENPEKYIFEASQNGVSHFLIPGSNLRDSIIALDIAKRFKNVYCVVGIHPSDVKNMKEDDLKNLEFLLKEEKVIGIGEIGLDFYWDKEEKIKTQQMDVFTKQIDLANKYNLPIVVHCREATEPIYKLLVNYPVKRGGIFHCYSSSVEMSQKFSKLGFIFGIGGTVTYKNAVTPKEVAQFLQDDQFVLETDAPYLPPVPHRGEQNHSKYLFLVRDQLAELRKVDKEHIEKVTSENFKRIFKL